MERPRRSVVPRATTTALPYIDPGETRLIGSDAAKLLSSRRLTVLHDRSNVCRNSVWGSENRQFTRKFGGQPAMRRLAKGVFALALLVCAPAALRQAESAIRFL